LCKKYNIFAGSSYEITNFEKLQLFISWKDKNHPMDEEHFKMSLVNAMRDDVVWDQADKEFMITYLKDIRYNGSKNLDEKSINRYKEASVWSSDEILREFWKLSQDQLYALGVKNPDDVEELKTKFKNDKIWFVTDIINNGSLLPWVILAILWWLFWWTWWAVWWFLLWTVWLTAYNAYSWNRVEKNWDEKAEDSWTVSNETTSNVPVTSSIFEKYSWIIKSERWNLDEKELSKVFLDLSNNDKFKNAPASTLDIFETEKAVSANIQKYFKDQLWIDITNENRKYYEHIFKKLKENRINSDIWTYWAWETINNYLIIRGSKLSKQTTWGNKVVSPEKAREQTSSEILTYFGIDKNSTKDLQKNLDMLWLDLFKFLWGYKNFIENNLSWLNPSILAKIKESIKIKVLLINKKIEELKKKEKNLNEFKNNRWIVNNLIQDLFKNLNTQVLPSALALVKNNWDTAKLKKTKEMFACNLTDDGDFDKTWTSFEIYDSIVNSWEVFDLEKDSEYLKNNWLNASDLDLTLLSERDIEVQSKAEIFCYAWLAALIGNDIGSFTWVWSVPWVIIWSSYSAVDLFNWEDNLISLWKASWYISKEYRVNKEWYENVLAWIWVIPLVWWWLRIVKNSEKLAIFISKLSPEKQVLFNNMISEISEMTPKFISRSFEKFWDTNSVAEAWTKLWKIPEDKFIVWVLEKLEVWKPPVKIWEVELSKLDNWRFLTKVWDDVREFDLKQVKELISNISWENKISFVQDIKRAELFAKFNWTPAKIWWYEVRIEKWSPIVRAKDGTYLEWEKREQTFLSSIQ
jgi:hypothetical protein